VAAAVGGVRVDRAAARAAETAELRCQREG
jgi:hypothetical protein